MTKRITHADISVYVMHPSGGYEVSAMVDGYRVKHYYYDYTKRQATQAFYNEVNGKNND